MIHSANPSYLQQLHLTLGAPYKTIGKSMQIVARFIKNAKKQKLPTLTWEAYVAPISYNRCLTAAIRGCSIKTPGSKSLTTSPRHEARGCLNFSHRWRCGMAGTIRAYASAVETSTGGFTNTIYLPCNVKSVDSKQSPMPVAKSGRFIYEERTIGPQAMPPYAPGHHRKSEAETYHATYVKHKPHQTNRHPNRPQTE